MASWLCGSFTFDLTQRPLIMGILNVTPDSFSDGYAGLEEAMAQAERLVTEGADIIDVGGESTRPGSEGVSKDEELSRIMPVIERLAGRFDVPISVDTQKPAVARRAIQAGASIINHVSATLDYQDMLEVVADTKVGYVAMHMANRPKVMQESPSYIDVVGELTQKLGDVFSTYEAAGIDKERLLPDPGIGFGKDLRHNLEIMRTVSKMSRSMNRPLLMGLSRKSWFSHLLGTSREAISELDAYTILTSSMLPFPEVGVHRVHNVRWMKSALKIRECLNRGF